MEQFDILIVGAGLSGIGAAWHLNRDCPGKNYAILEAREAIGGTWDLFRYPGIRSDSDMYTLGYDFRPWREQKAIADGPSILRYVRDTAREGDIERRIRFRHKVVSADFDTASARWTVTAETPDGERTYSAKLLLMAAGYYSYDNPYNPPLPGEERFGGAIFHPQHWPQGLETTGKRIIVIGSGATAVTIVPVLAETAAHVTMLQRTATWMISRPAEDRLANRLRRILPARWAYAIIRWRNTLLQSFFFRLSRRNPAKANQRVREGLLKELPAEQVDAHFTPAYNVWDQRLCLVPDSDFFAAIRAGRAEVVTDRIAEIEEDGIRLESGRRLDADIIVKATGLRLQMMGGAALSIDGQPQSVPERFIYRGLMVEGIPNLVYIFGYFNASWTLRADLSARWFCKLANEMDRRRADIAVPRMTGAIDEESRLFSSGYVQRAEAVLPRQGAEDPWRDTQDYYVDRKALASGPTEDGALHFEKARARQPA